MHHLLLTTPTFLGGRRNTNALVVATVRRTSRRTRARKMIGRVKVKTRPPSTLRNVLGGIATIITAILTWRLQTLFQPFVLAVGGAIVVKPPVLRAKVAGLRLLSKPSNTRTVSPVTMEETGRAQQAPVIVAVIRVAVVF